MTKQETIKAMAILSAGYPNQVIREETIEIYARMLRDFDFETVNAAIQDIIAQSRFFPSIAEIRQTVIERRLDFAPAEAAWGEVMSEVRRVGSYHQPIWSSEPVAAAVQAIGWRNICMCELDQLNTLRAQFERMYRTYRERAIQDGNLGSLGIARQPERLRDPKSQHVGRCAHAAYRGDSAISGGRTMSVDDTWDRTICPECQARASAGCATCGGSGTVCPTCRGAHVVRLPHESTHPIYKGCPDCTDGGWPNFTRDYNRERHAIHAAKGRAA